MFPSLRLPTARLAAAAAAMRRCPNPAPIEFPHISRLSSPPSACVRVPVPRPGDLGKGFSIGRAPGGVCTACLAVAGGAAGVAGVGVQVLACRTQWRAMMREK